jgi:hypothetical protein
MCIPPIVARHQLGKHSTIVARQRLGKNVTGSTNTHIELLDASFSMRSVSYQRKQTISCSQNSLFFSSVKNKTKFQMPPQNNHSSKGAGRWGEKHASLSRLDFWGEKMTEGCRPNINNLGKVVPAQLIKHYAMRAYGEVDVYSHIFLTSALVGEWSALPPGKAPGTHWIWGWVGLDLDVVKKRKLLTLPGLELRLLGRPARSQSLYRSYPGSEISLI